MNLDDLKEQLQENIITYISYLNACAFPDTHIESNVLDTLCKIVVDTFDKAFYRPAP